MGPLRLATPNRRSNYYPHFPAAEIDRRRQTVRQFMAERDLDALLLYDGGGVIGDNLTFLTDYDPMFATYVVFFRDPGEPTTAFVGISNHVQFVREVAEVDDIRLMLPDPPVPVCERLDEVDVAIDRLGLVTRDPRYNLSIPIDHYRTFETELDAELLDVTPAYTRLAAVLSPEERDLVRDAASLLDRAMEALEETIAPGVTERTLGAALHKAALDGGGRVGAEFISSAPMEEAEPGEPLPWKHPSSRQLSNGDVVTTEISVSVRGYFAQIHRPFAVGAPPTVAYTDLLTVAEEACDRMVAALKPGNSAADVVAAADPIGASDYKIYDVLCHGFGRGYRHPFIGIEDSNYWPGSDDPLTADWTFEPGMVLVIQPNVVTPDETAALQYGTTVLVGRDGPIDLQTYPAGFRRV